MDSINDLIEQIPMDQLADRLGVDRATAEQATRKALPALLAGLNANAQDPSGAASIVQALGKHSTSVLSSGMDLSQVDAEDGDAIVGHVFGANREQVVNKLANDDAADPGLIGKLLPMLAPMVLSWLAGRFLGGKQPAAAPSGTPIPGADDLSDLVPGDSEVRGGGLGDLLGSVLGGGKSGGQGDGGSITDILGGLLGGGRR